jgi:hypothetical protein
MEITRQQYEDALKIVKAYESQANEQEQLILAEITKELKEYFKTHLVQDISITSFQLEFDNTFGKQTNVVDIRLLSGGNWEEQFYDENVMNDFKKIGLRYNKILKVPSWYLSK